MGNLRFPLDKTYHGCPQNLSPELEPKKNWWLYKKVAARKGDGVYGEKGGFMMQIIQMIWNGISGPGPGTVLLKALYILVLGAIFWTLCEMFKYIVNVFAKLAVDALRYLAIVVRGWPKDAENAVDKRDTSRWNQTDRQNP